MENWLGLGQSTFKIAVKIKEILICKSHLLTEKSVLELLLTKEYDILSIWECSAVAAERIHQVS